MDIKALESTPFNTDNWNNWEKTAAGIDLEILEDVFPDARHIVGPREGVLQQLPGTLLRKKVSGFIIGATYKMAALVRNHQQSNGPTSIQLGVEGLPSGTSAAVGNGSFAQVNHYFIARQSLHTLTIGSPGGNKNNAFYLDSTSTVQVPSITETFNTLPNSPTITAGGTIRTPHMDIHLPAGQPGMAQIHSDESLGDMRSGQCICLYHHQSAPVPTLQRARITLKEVCASLKFSLTRATANTKVWVYDNNDQLLTERNVPLADQWLTFDSLPGRFIKRFEVQVTSTTMIDNVMMINR
ncbi:hypothetical protein LOY37_01280 [Pseudomonas sp. B21-012]|uniref:hypothetical protein n=1 Tax=Pseudomonas sp. B21-012 TaxID=2895472 RepID=UPI00215EB6D0|nr:hypothetical protein [Pseudomonas sp. B21-012]UVM56240.1 hypothetical protein LOY37_01280 [Pseudomonas sp. B21-012]